MAHGENSQTSNTRKKHKLAKRILSSLPFLLIYVLPVHWHDTVWCTKHQELVADFVFQKKEKWSPILRLRGPAAGRGETRKGGR